MKLSPRTTATFTLGLLTAAVLAGCATTAPSEQAPSPAVSVDRQAAAVSACADGNDCAIGDIGPGGGIVFYDAGSVQSWGRYLEAAPTGWHGTDIDPEAPWCDIQNEKLDGAGGDRIGTGDENTNEMVVKCSSGAANLARAYTGGGKADWFLPSQAELSELRKQMETVGYWGLKAYWSSSQSDNYYAKTQNFPSGGWANYDDKSRTLGVRPIRAF